MPKTAVILGARGRFGRNSVDAFLAAGWNVVAVARTINTAIFPSAVEIRSCDLTDQHSTVTACAGADVIVHAAHPAYTDWVELTPIYTRNVLAAAQKTGATVMIPCNIYNYGASMPEVLTEDTPHVATTRKGQVRIDMEDAFEAATHDGIQTVILRSGDFFEGVDTGTWLETYIAGEVHKGAITYPGPMDVVHAWAYLPDMARALVELAEIRNDLSPFEEFGFDGYALTGHQLKSLIEQAVGRSLKVKSMPWGIMRLLSPFKALIREVLEMRYLWTTPHRIDGRKLSAALPNFQPTQVEDAIAKAVA